MINNIDYYDKIIKSFANLKKLPIEKELFTDYMIVELMHIFDITQNKQFVQNSLILMLAMTHDKFTDTFEYKSKALKKLLENERDNILSCLQQELL